MVFEKEKTQIDTDFMASLELAKSYPQLFTDRFLSYLASDALTSNVHLMIGTEIPNIQINK